MKEDQELYSQIQALIEERIPIYFPEYGSGLRPRLIPGKVRRGSSTQVFLLNLAGIGGEIVGKVFAKIPVNHLVTPSKEYQFRQAKREYDALQSLWYKFASSPRLRIPRPLDFIPELNLIVVEGVSGIPLNTLLNRWSLPLIRNRRRNDLEQNFRLAGEWLAYLHRVTYEKDAAFSIDVIISQLETEMEESVVPISKEGKRLILKKISDLAPCDVSQPFTGCHGDFTCGNILISNGTITPIDFSYYDYNFVYVDLSRFLYVLAESRIPWFNSRLVQKMAGFFLESYAHYGFQVDAKVLAFFEAVMAIKTLCSYSQELEGIRRGRQSRYNILRKAYYKWEVKRLTEDLISLGKGD